jgi:hypothetical protein
VCAGVLSACGGSQAARPESGPKTRVSTLACGAFAELHVGTSTFSSTDEGTHALHGSCSESALPACVFTLDVPARADARLRLESSGFDGALALFGGPREHAVELACVDDTPSGDPLHARVDATLPAGRYWVVVDSADGSQGEFELFVELDALEPLSEACAAPRTLREGITLRDSTRGGANQFSSTCASGAPGPDHVYALSVPEPSRVRVRQSSEYDGALTLRKTCADPSSEVACNDDGPEAMHSALTARVDAGTYYLIADSFSEGQSGEYTLTAERVPEPPARTLAEVCDESDALPVAPGHHELDTLRELSRMEGSCGGVGAPEQRLHFEVHEPSLLRGTLVQPEFASVVYLLRDCRDEATEVACFDSTVSKKDAEPLPLSFERELSPGAYTLVLDGKTAEDMGATGLSFSLEPRAKAAKRAKPGATPAPRVPAAPRP